MSADMAKTNRVRDEVFLSGDARVHNFFGHDFDAGGSYFARPEFGQNILFAKVETSVCCDVWHGRWSQNATRGKVVAVFYRSSLLILLNGVDSSSHDQNSFVWTQGSFFTHWHGNLLWSHLIPCYKNKPKL